MVPDSLTFAAFPIAMQFVSNVTFATIRAQRVYAFVLTAVIRGATFVKF